MSYMEMKEAMQTVGNVAKETQKALQAVVDQQDDTEPRPVSIYDAISSLCDDIIRYYNDPEGNHIRAKAIRQLADAYKILASIPQPVDVMDPMQMLQGLKDYCAVRADCDQCKLDAETCKRLLGDDIPPSDWDLPGICGDKMEV